MIDQTFIESSIAYLKVIDDVLYIILKDDADIRVEDVKEMITIRKRIQKESKMLVLADIRKVWQASMQARTYAAKSKMTSLNIAMTIVTDSLASKMLANFFIRFNRPKSPTKMFNSEEKALEWLETFR